MRKAPVRENPVRKKGDLRETIRDKAGELFGRVGYGNITVEDIANHLGISKASIYYHFASKEEIYFEFQLLSHEKALEGIKGIAKSDLPPQEKLKKAIEYHVDLLSFGLSKPVMVDLHWRFVFPKKLAAPIRRLRKQYDKYLREIINEGIEKGVIVNLDQNILGFIICGAINFLPQWYHPKGSLSQEQVKDVVCTCLMKGLLK